MTARFSLDQINALSSAQFIDTFGGVYEHSPWVAERAEARRPFASREALEQTMRDIVEQAGDDARLAILRAHPEFAGREAETGSLTRESSAEQGRLSLNRLPAEQLQRMREINAHYMRVFGFPGIVAVRLHRSVDSVFDELDRRRHNALAVEAREAIEQVYHIVHFRLQDLIATDHID